MQLRAVSTDVSLNLWNTTCMLNVSREFNFREFSKFAKFAKIKLTRKLPVIQYNGRNRDFTIIFTFSQKMRCNFLTILTQTSSPVVSWGGRISTKMPLRMGWSHATLTLKVFPSEFGHEIWHK